MNFDESAHTLKHNGTRLSQFNISPALITFAMDVPKLNAMTTIDRSTAVAVVFDMDKKVQLFAGNCTKIDPEHRAF